MYKRQAYATAGLSANAYMETVTGFAASLKQSFDGTAAGAQAAAIAADMAVTDIADNANKMGTNMQDIQNAYQGFAKQNYTMLDNLKLGYGGTQAEMQRLLKDAEKISGVHYDLGNLADMYSAIHVIQKEMDITGTTAKEASTTLTGSFAAMKAAAENVLADWSTGADLTAPLQGLVETAQTFLVGNLLPMIGNVLAGIPELVYTLVPEILQSGTQLVTSLAEGFSQGIPDFLSNALPQLLQFTEELRANAGVFVDAGLNLITQLLNGLIAGLPDNIKSPILTAEWESMLKQVEHGELSATSFMDQIADMSRTLVKEHTTPEERFADLFPSSRGTAHEAVGVCPRCGAPVYEGKKGFFCDNRECSFALWKDNRFFSSKKKSITKSVAAALLKEGRISMSGLYSEKTGKTYDAEVILDDTGGKYVNFKLEFPVKKGRRK